MVDPKMVELSVYNTLPHLRHKVITDNRDAAGGAQVGGDGDAGALRAARRERLPQPPGLQQARAGRRRRSSCRSDKDVAFEDTTYKGGILPYIVVVIDEMADLMMTVQGEVETPIAHARAEGARDRHPPDPRDAAAERERHHGPDQGELPEPDRVPRRVARSTAARSSTARAPRCCSATATCCSSRRARAKPARLQGAYLSSEETENADELVRGAARAKRAALAAAGLVLEAEMSPDEPDILETVRTREAEARAALEGGAEEGGADARIRDKLFREAAELCIQNQSGSTSLLQRRLEHRLRPRGAHHRPAADAGVLGPPRAARRGARCASGSRISIASAAPRNRDPHAARARRARRASRRARRRSKDERELTCGCRRPGALIRSGRSSVRTASSSGPVPPPISSRSSATAARRRSARERSR